MATVVLADPPAAGGTYEDFRPWLLAHFFDHLCAYCLLTDHGAEIDHFEPRELSEHRVHDPTNLLLSCRRCNRSKSDYHPSFARRRRRPGDTSGTMVIDVRDDDYAALFMIGPSGRISPSSGPNGARAAWNIVLLNLDLPSINDRRRQLMELREACESALALRDGELDDVSRVRLRSILAKLLEELARRLLFFKVYGLDLSPRLRVEAENVLTDLTQAGVGGTLEPG
jgi:uncharacterized protein (TIGR02646 family)